MKLYEGNRSESARRLMISPRRLRRLLNGGDVGSDLEEDDLVEVTTHSIQSRSPFPSARPRRRWDA